jgi:hypothetical protein
VVFVFFVFFVSFVLFEFEASTYSRGMDNPPSTWMTLPVAYGASPRTSAATTRPTSSGVPQRRSGTSPFAINQS